MNINDGFNLYITDFKYFIFDVVQHLHPPYLKVTVNINIPISHEVCLLSTEASMYK